MSDKPFIPGDDKPAPAITGILPPEISTVALTSATCSSGVIEYISPVPPAATSAANG